MPILSMSYFKIPTICQCNNMIQVLIAAFWQENTPPRQGRVTGSWGGGSSPSFQRRWSLPWRTNTGLISQCLNMTRRNTWSWPRTRRASCRIKLEKICDISLDRCYLLWCFLEDEINETLEKYRERQISRYLDIDVNSIFGDRCPTFFCCDGSVVFHKIPISSPGVLGPDPTLATHTTPLLSISEGEVIIIHHLPHLLITFHNIKLWNIKCWKVSIAWTMLYHSIPFVTDVTGRK